MSNKHTNKYTPLLISLLLLIILFTGCGSRSLPIISEPFRPGKILLLPPRDLVQKGEFHPAGVGSGKIFQGYLRQTFLDTPFKILVTDNEEFDNTKISRKEDVLKEGKHLNADYCLQIVLGEFLNAAPMTFRPDHASVEKAVMYDVATGDIVWELLAPLDLQKSNIGNHLVLLEKHAQIITQSILRNGR